MALQPTPLRVPALLQGAPGPILPHPRPPPGAAVPTSLPRIWSSVSCTSMRGRTVVKSFHQGQSFTPLFFLMFFCTQRMAKSWICAGGTRRRHGCCGAPPAEQDARVLSTPAATPAHSPSLACGLIAPGLSAVRLPPAPTRANLAAGEAPPRCLFYALFNNKKQELARPLHPGTAQQPGGAGRSRRPRGWPHGSPRLPTAPGEGGRGGRRRRWARRRQKSCAAHFRRNCAAERGGERRHEPSSS